MSATTQTVQNELDILQEAHRMQNETLFQPLVRGVKSLIGNIVADFRRAAMRRQLEALDDRMLRDIGLRRDGRLQPGWWRRADACGVDDRG